MASQNHRHSQFGMLFCLSFDIPHLILKPLEDGVDIFRVYLDLSFFDIDRRDEGATKGKDGHEDE